MVQSSDIAGRMRLLRYGLITMVIVTFLVSWLLPYVITSAYATELNSLAAAVEASSGQAVPRADITLFTFLPQALLFTAGSVVLAVVVFFAYRTVISRSSAAS